MHILDKRVNEVVLKDDSSNLIIFINNICRQYD